MVAERPATIMQPETCESLFILLLHFVLLCLDLLDNLCVLGIVSFIAAAMAFFVFLQEI